MPARPRLTPSMTLTEFDHGYWYATELKQFARELGIGRTATLRKDQLEHAIKQFLRSGNVARSERSPSPKNTPRDVDLGLTLRRRIVRYTNDPATKNFLEREAKKRAPHFKRRSGARYRLNRWREEQIRAGSEITYGDLVQEYIRLCTPSVEYRKIPTGRYINFVSDFLADRPDTARQDILSAWHALKTVDCPKTYRAWVAACAKRPSRISSRDTT